MSFARRGAQRRRAAFASTPALACVRRNNVRPRNLVLEAIRPVSQSVRRHNPKADASTRKRRHVPTSCALPIASALSRIRFVRCNAHRHHQAARVSMRPRFSAQTRLALLNNLVLDRISGVSNSVLLQHRSRNAAMPLVADPVEFRFHAKAMDRAPRFF